MNFKKLICILLISLMMFSVLSAFTLADEVEEQPAEEQTTENAEGEETPEGEKDPEAEGKDETFDASQIVITEEGMTGDGTTGKLEDLASFTLASENKNLAFYVNDNTGFFALLNKKTNDIWYSNPLDWEKDQIAQATNREQLQSQLVVTYLNASYDILTIPSTEAHIVSEHIGNKQYFTYVFNGATRNFSIPVCFELKDDYLDVSVLIEDIEENSDARITQITLLPFLACGGLKDNGYALVPDGSGSLMAFNKSVKNLSQYTGYIYNRDITASSDSASYVDLNETISLPVYGIYKNGAGVLAVLTEGEGSSAIKANVSRLFNSYNSITSHIIVRDTQTRRNSTGTTGAGVYYSSKTSGNMGLHIYPLAKEDASYVGMAKRYRKYLIDEKGLSPLDNTSAVTNALNIELFCAVKSPTHFLGIPYTGVKKLTSFDDTKTIISDLKEKGIDKSVITLRGWNSGGLESTLTTKVSVDNKVGKTKEIKDLVAFAEENGSNIVFDNDVQTFYYGTSQVKKFKHTAFSLSNTPVTVYPFSKSLNRSVMTGKFYNLIHPEFMVEFTDKIVDNSLKHGIKNFSFISAGSDPYAAYNKENMVTRDISTGYMETLFANAKAKTDGIISTSVGNSFVLGSVNNIVEAPVFSSDLIMSQTSVPFYQIALRGYINLSATAMNLSSEVTELELKCAETASSLFYQLMYSESTAFENTSFTDYYACSYTDYADIISETYGRMKKVYDAVGASTISNHEIKGDVRITTFSNGAKVYVNYGKKAAKVNGVKVAKRSYTVVGGDK